MRRILPTILRGIPSPDETIAANGRFQLNVITNANVPANKLDWLFLALNDTDFLGGQTNVQSSGPAIAVNGRSAGGMKAKDLYARLLDVVDNYFSISDASLVVEGTPLPPLPPREVSTREPITPREEDRPVVVVDPVTNEPVDTGNGSTGNGSNGSQSNGTEEPSTLPFPIGSSGKIFGIEPKYLLIGGVALFFLMRKK